MYSDHELLLISPAEFDLLETWDLKPDWRFMMASKGIETWFASIRYIKEMMQYLDVRRRNRNELPTTCNDNKDMQLAHGSYWLHKNNKKRLMIEAYIMAGATNEQLINTCPCKEGIEVFEWYRKLFFDVDDYQESNNIIFATVIGPLYTKHIENPSELLTLEIISKRLATHRDVGLIDDFNDVLNSKPATKALKEALLKIAESSQILTDLLESSMGKSNKPTELKGPSRVPLDPSVSLKRLLKRIFGGIC